MTWRAISGRPYTPQPQNPINVTVDTVEPDDAATVVDTVLNDFLGGLVQVTIRRFEPPGSGARLCSMRMTGRGPRRKPGASSYTLTRLSL